MWFTSNECPKNSNKYYWFVFAVLVTNTALVMRQLLGGEEIDTLGIIVGSLLSVGFLYLLATGIIWLYTGGCFGINEWWLLLSVCMYPTVLIINELTYKVVGPVSILPFMFWYPALTIKAEGKKAAEASILALGTVLGLAVVCYYIANAQGWWDLGVRFGGTWLDRVYRYAVGGIALSGVLAVFMALVPIGVYAYRLPGFWIFRYKHTAIYGIIIILICLDLLTYGGLLRTIVNTAYGGYAIW